MLVLNRITQVRSIVICIMYHKKAIYEHTEKHM